MYKVDIEEAYGGARRVQWVMGWVDRLIDEPMSRFRAKLASPDDWREHVGWSPSAFLLASLVDAVNINSAVTQVQGTGRRPKMPTPHYRPPVGPTVVPDLDDVPAMFTGLMGG